MKTCCLSFLVILACTISSICYSNSFVINEILFAPDDSELEFIELLNLSTSPLDMCAFSFSDDRDIIVPICESSYVIEAGAYAVLARNGTLLGSFFPGHSFVTPSSLASLKQLR